MSIKSKLKSTSDQVVVNGFTVVPVRFSEKSKAGHYLYVKEHSTRDSTEAKPKGKTLFVLNVPPYCNEECLERLFSVCGDIKKVHLHKTPTSVNTPKEESKWFKSVPTIKGFKVGYIVFNTPSGVDKAKLIPFGEPLLLSTRKNPIPTGVRKWCSEYREDVADAAELKQEVVQWMADFDRKLEEEEEAAKVQEGVPDEDGWVTVTRHARNKPSLRTEATQEKVHVKDREKRKQKELINFYAFQMRESKREHIAQLRQKFEDDKSKIQIMKSARKFRPY